MYFFTNAGFSLKSGIALLAFFVAFNASSILAQGEDPKDPPEGTSQLCCEDNLVVNGTFEDGNDPTGNESFSGCPPASPHPFNWCSIYSPQYKNNLGFNQTYGVVAGRAVQMWGVTTWTQNHGEAIYQEVPFTAGTTYGVRFDAHFLDVGNLGPDSVIVRFRAYHNQPTSVNPAGGDLIGEAFISDLSYNTYYFPAWFCLDNYSYLLVSVHNTHPTDNNGNYISWGRIDNICMQRVQPYQDPPGKLPAPGSSLEELPELFPNPNDGHFSIAYPESYGAVKRVVIYDLNGRAWPVDQLRIKEGELAFDVVTLANGQYQVQVEFEGNAEPYSARFQKL